MTYDFLLISGGIEKLMNSLKLEAKYGDDP